VLQALASYVAVKSFHFKTAFSSFLMSAIWTKNIYRSSDNSDILSTKKKKVWKIGSKVGEKDEKKLVELSRRISLPQCYSCLWRSLSSA